MIPAYPLTWPHGWPRSHPLSVKDGRFKAGRQNVTIAGGVQRVREELLMLGISGEDSVISTNVKTRLDGFPRSDQAEPSDSGVAVYWQDGEHRRVMAIDRYTRVAENLCAIAATLSSLRAIERHGGGKILERAFTGFTALPAPGQIHARGWVEVLEITPGSIQTHDTVKAQYRRLSSQRHPDRPGGSHEAMAELNWAWAQAQEALA